MKQKIIGKLEAFFETGTEGIIWSVYDENNQGYASLHTLKDGDFLEVFNDDNSIFWSGIIKFDWKIRYRQYPNNLKYGQQEVLGYWVHGLQEGIEPEIWAKMFFNGKKSSLIRS